MARCTAPTKGHRTASGRAACPACGGRYGYRPSSSYSISSYSPSGYNLNSRPTNLSQKPRWSKPGSTIVYSTTEIRTLTPIRETFEKRAHIKDLRDIFLCHAWDDRKEAAKELHDELEKKGVSVWFSEKDVNLGRGLMREIDKGLAASKVGIVLVTPAFLNRLAGESIAEKELSALLARDQLVPIVHQTTFERLRNVSPLLGEPCIINGIDGFVLHIEEGFRFHHFL